MRWRVCAKRYRTASGSERDQDATSLNGNTERGTSPTVTEGSFRGIQCGALPDGRANAPGNTTSEIPTNVKRLLKQLFQLNIAPT